MTSKRVAVALSGGVDSAVAAYILKEQGYNVSAITMVLSQYTNKSADSAIQIAERLKIPLNIIDLSQLFNEKIIMPFCNEYSIGRTPNPCISCNYHIKFGVLLDKAKEAGADFLAAGHYARVDKTLNGFRLLKGIDIAKDQSYFLYRLEQEQLKYILMPLGGLTKIEVKKKAKKLGFDSVIEQESQDICFIPENDKKGFIEKNIDTRAGDVIDTEGKLIGQHKGLAYYTIGQRQGLGLSASGRRYIVKLDAKNNSIVLGERELLFSKRLAVGYVNWTSRETPESLQGITAKIRYNAPESSVKIRFIDDFCEVEFKQPQWAITPGQSVVFYRKDEVLGGGIIESPVISERVNTYENNM